MDELKKKDDALFEALNRKKKKKRRKIIRTVILIVLLLGAGLTAGTFFLRRRVARQFSGNDKDVSSAEVTRGSISTQVSGSGTLINVDEESLTVPAGVTIEELCVSAGETVQEGQILARVDIPSVLTAMDSLQDKMSSLDTDLYKASSDSVNSLISSGVEGRVKKLYAKSGDDIVRCMAENGALAVLSLDGKMALAISAPNLTPGESVTVVRDGGKELPGTVDTVIGDTATILITDDGPELDETVKVFAEDGTELGQGSLTVHSALRIAGISGTVSYVHVEENQRVYSGSSLFTLSGTSYYARYQTLLNERAELEKTLLELMELYRNGAVLAPYSGSVSSVEYDEDTADTSSETALVTLSPDISMQVTVNVDESKILSLELGQRADITVSSIGDETFPGRVTEINKTANSSSGVTRYSAVITLNKTEAMLQGMSAKAVIRIQGVEDALIIPIDALHQTSSSSFVYTAYDEETGEFGGLVPVTAGITNSSYAEITSGLQEGDTVYYTKKQSNNFDPRNFGGMPNTGGGGNFNGGNRPSGGSGFSGGNGSSGNRPGGNGNGGGNFSGGGGFNGGGGNAPSRPGN